jgi:hypothetical protein
MQARYFQINRTAYTVAELSAITVGPRRLLLPAYIARLLVLKLFRKVVPIGDPIADTRLMAPLSDEEISAIPERYAILSRADATLSRLGFNGFGYFRTSDPRFPYESFSLYAVDGPGATAVVCTVMGKGEISANWIESFSPLVDGRTLRCSNHAMAGALRPAPSAIIRRTPGASCEGLLDFHIAEMQRMRSTGLRFIEGMTPDAAVRTDREYYREQIAHWIETGLPVSVE